MANRTILMSRIRQILRLYVEETGKKGDQKETINNE